MLMYVKISIISFPHSARPLEKVQRQKLRKEMQQEFRGLLQKRMTKLLQVS